MGHARVTIAVRARGRFASEYYVTSQPMIEAGGPVAWTWLRRRIHEPCMPACLVSSRRPFGPWVGQAVRLSLETNGGQVCTACLALGFSLRRVGDVLCLVPD